MLAESCSATLTTSLFTLSVFTESRDITVSTISAFSVFALFYWFAHL
jgi:hypothetical protein